MDLWMWRESLNKAFAFGIALMGAMLAHGGHPLAGAITGACASLFGAAVFLLALLQLPARLAALAGNARAITGALCAFFLEILLGCALMALGAYAGLHANMPALAKTVALAGFSCLGLALPFLHLGVLFNRFPESAYAQMTPRSKIRSASQGMVELHGIARVLEPQDRADDESGPAVCWGHNADEPEKPFALEDETGRCVLLLPEAIYTSGGAIYDGDTIIAVGHFQTVRGNDPLHVHASRPPQKIRDAMQKITAARFARLLENPEHRARADLNQDGVLSAGERYALKQRIEAEFMSRYRLENPEETHVLGPPGVPGLPHYICAESESSLLRSHGWEMRLAWLQLYFGLPVVAWALAEVWSR